MQLTGDPRRLANEPGSPGFIKVMDPWPYHYSFGKTEEDAHAVMLKVHNEGVGICGVYTYEVAETKVAKVSQEAQANGHPLKCTAEPE